MNCIGKHQKELLIYKKKKTLKSQSAKLFYTQGIEENFCRNIKQKRKPNTKQARISNC